MNLVIATVGDTSLHKEWLSDKPNFDLVLLYYGNDLNIAKSYTQDTPYIYASKGFKFSLIKSFINDNLEWVSKYEYIWLPDDDLKIDTKSINELFSIAKKYDLYLCQPSLLGYISHQITAPQENSLLRYTNFVEIMAPLMNLNTILKLKETFNVNYSSWGLDFIWSYLLNDPQDKIAIIDTIKMTHTKPVGNPKLYSQFPHSLEIDMQLAFDEFTNGVKYLPKEYKCLPLNL
jgi:hypothetical protein